MKLNKLPISFGYKHYYIIILFISVLCGIFFEKICYRFIKENAELLFENYIGTVLSHEATEFSLFCYLIREKLKRLLLILLLSFTVLGFPITVLNCFIEIFRYFFTISAFFRYYEGSKLLTAYIVLSIPILFSIIIFYCYFRISFNGSVYCINTDCRIYHMSKNQLQIFFKLSIILLIVIIFSAFMEAYLCTNMLSILY